jgi:hypothetical protein
VGSAGERGLFILFRGMNHVKLICQPEKPLEAKAYFGGRYLRVQHLPDPAAPPPA